MKPIILAALLAVSSFGVAAQDNQPERGRYCILLAATYSNAIHARNRSLDPKQALAMTPPEISMQVRKDAVNQVYFDPIFKGVIDSEDARFEIMQACLHDPKKPFEPLK